MARADELKIGTQFRLTLPPYLVRMMNAGIGDSLADYELVHSKLGSAWDFELRFKVKRRGKK